MTRQIITLSRHRGPKTRFRTRNCNNNGVHTRLYPGQRTMLSGVMPELVGSGATNMKIFVFYVLWDRGMIHCPQDSALTTWNFILLEQGTTLESSVSSAQHAFEGDFSRLRRFSKANYLSARASRRRLISTKASFVFTCPIVKLLACTSCLLCPDSLKPRFDLNRDFCSCYCRYLEIWPTLSFHAPSRTMCVRCRWSVSLWP